MFDSILKNQQSLMTHLNLMFLMFHLYLKFVMLLKNLLNLMNRLNLMFLKYR